VPLLKHPNWNPGAKLRLLYGAIAIPAFALALVAWLLQALDRWRKTTSR
jgi:hypothetical protein